MNTYDNLELISVHIPKCGGTTFSNVLYRIYGDKFAHITNISQLKDINQDIRCIHGHYLFDPEWLKIYPNAKICTWIRNPVDRIVSYYVHLKTWKGPAEHITELHDRVRNGLSIFDFAEINNNMFAYIEKIALNDIDFIGNISNYRSNVSKLSKIMNWDDFIAQRYSSYRMGKYNHPAVRDLIITDKDRKELASILYQDMKRYKYIKQYYAKFYPNYWRYASCKEKHDWYKVPKQKIYLPS